MTSYKIEEPKKQLTTENNDSMDQQKRHILLERIRKNAVVKWLGNSENVLVTLTVASVIFGILIGISVKAGSNPGPKTVKLLAYPGELMLNMLKMLIIPLIVSSLVTGVAQMDVRSSRRMGFFAFAYYISTTFAAVILGIILVLTIHPGDPSMKGAKPSLEVNKKVADSLDAFLDLIRNIFPPNIIQACIQQYQTIVVNKTYDEPAQFIIVNPNDTANFSTANFTKITREVTDGKFEDTTNMLGLVAFSMFLGVILGQMQEKALPMVAFFSVLNEVTMRMVKIVMWFAPVGIFFLILSKILEIDDLVKTVSSLAKYMATVILGLIIHSCGTLAISFFALTRKNPFVFFKGIFQAWVTALGTASSAATLPVTFRCLEDNLGIDKRVTRFVLPVGATINMDGTALYEAVASIFIAQVNAVSLSAGQVVTVSVTATLAAIGAASVPSAGLVTMLLVLNSVGLPTGDISLIFAVDWLLDRLRTSINVVGDAFGAGIVDHFCKEHLQQIDKEAEEEINNIITESNIKTSPDGHPVKKRRISIAAAMKLTDEQTIANTALHSIIEKEDTAL